MLLPSKPLVAYTNQSISARRRHNVPVLSYAWLVEFTHEPEAFTFRVADGKLPKNKTFLPELAENVRFTVISNLVCKPDSDSCNSERRLYGPEGLVFTVYK